MNLSLKHTTNPNRNLLVRLGRLTLVAAVIGLTALPADAAALGLRRRPIAGRIASTPQANLGHRLGLTPEQRDEIRAVLQSHRAEIALVVTELRKTRLALRDQIRQTDTTDAAIRAAAAKVAAVEVEAAVLRHHLFLEIRPILTDDQLARLAELEEQREALVASLLERLLEFLQD